jgi:hypothetical protein
MRHSYTRELMGAKTSDEERAAEAQSYLETRRRVHHWLKEDREAWEHERLAVVRAWYADHPHSRRAFDTARRVDGWWSN